MTTSAMKNQELEDFIEKNIIIPFYRSRSNSLENKKLKDLLQSKNPYLFRAKNITSAEEFSRQMLDAFLSSSEETIFGNSLEKLAIYVNSKVYGGYKPPEGEFPSIDLIFEREGVTYVVGIKSGGVWGNADSINQMVANLQRHHKPNSRLISGICYGKSMIKQCEVKEKQLKDGKSKSVGTGVFYYKYVGKELWSLISGSGDFYTEIIEPLGSAVKGRDIDFHKQYSQKLNQLTQELLNDYCIEGLIDWKKILQTNSGL